MPPFCEIIVDGDSTRSLEEIRKQVSYDILNDTDITEESSSDSAEEGSSRSSIVQFNDVTEIHEIPTCKEFTEETIQTCYYTKKELALCKPVEYRNFSKCCDGECLRGFEGWAGKGGSIRRKYTMSTRKSVLGEQKSLNEIGTAVDPIALARFYGTLTLQSEEEARTVALADELYVRRYVYELPCSAELLEAEQRVRDTVQLKLCSCNREKAPKKASRRFSKQKSMESVKSETSTKKPSSLPKFLKRFTSKRSSKA